VEDGQTGGEKVLEEHTERARHEKIEGSTIQQKKDVTFVCPVCEKPLHTSNLVDMKSIVEDNLYYVGGVKIVSDTILHCDFEHRYDEEGFTLENPHPLVATVKAAFDITGDCIHFTIVDIRAPTL